MTESWNDLVPVLLDAGFKLGVAVVCGLLLGFERERRDKPAGLRTILLITVGSTLFMIVSHLIVFIADWPGAVTRVDPSRIASQVVTGVGFLGAGSIIQARGSIHGLTTAAVIWVAAGVGLCVGVGYPLLALALTTAVVLILVVLNPVRHWLSRRGVPRTLDLIVPNDTLTVRRLELVLQQHDVRPDEIDMQPWSEEDICIRVVYNASTHDSTARLLNVLARVEGCAESLSSTWLGKAESGCGVLGTPV